MLLRHLTVALGLVGLCATPTLAAETPGVTATEIKIGSIFPFSGPASSLGNTGKGLIAYVKSINDRGGISGRKIDFITYDDAYSPPKAVEQARKLAESDEVAFMFGQLGTPSNAATIKYLNGKKIPDAFIMTGANKFANFQEYPYTTTGLPSYDTEARVYARFAGKSYPNGKIAILFQNDDLGKDFVNAFKDVLKDKAAAQLTAIGYEITDPTVDSQIVNLKASGAQSLLIAATPKFAAQALRKLNDIGWKPLTMINMVSSSVSATLQPVGLDKVEGVVSAAFFKDPNDPKWADDAGMKEYRAFFDKYLAGSDFADLNYLTGFQQGKILEQLLNQCGNDLTRDNVVKQSRSIRGLQLPTALPGIVVNTDSGNSKAWTQLQLQRWNGTVWEAFGDVLSGAE
ncbi:MAG: branched-chain amino acid transporter substrate-binding protein [Tardiphaga sp.]|uniref:ABC transporter substrate-binding protein n=1 Tax=Tardiphaga sp. TaxID=1926292 RepID=UPI002616FA0C|nr:ABC transporter substrate-binding protein [Tardiphaga sp.]MDB5503791.1 branched-chain amino acid transporter substrate-binding protein [Tardiphaga sp.]